MHLDLDEIAQQDIAAALRPGTGSGAGEDQQGGPAATHHGAGDARQAARDRSGRDRAGRAGNASGGRSYVFRRS
ncbi:hypothetical protein [Actinoplanes sp. NPDC026670]|uniref:hypothetical protein n=1 Tax=Actinoplanes sp. NPDC026670 TaxID=3154700 RepID=UPI0033DE4AAA